MLKIGQIYFRNPALFTPQDFKSMFGRFQHPHERVDLLIVLILAPVALISCLFHQGDLPM